MKNKSFWVVQGKAEMLDDMKNELSDVNPDYEPCWTVPKGVVRGDVMIIYLMKPISSIVARAVFTSEPFIFDNPDSIHFDRRMATFENLKMFEKFVSLAEMKKLFPNWWWTTRPQGAVKVPDEHAKTFEYWTNFLD